VLVEACCHLVRHCRLLIRLEIDAAALRRPQAALSLRLLRFVVSYAVPSSATDLSAPATPKIRQGSPQSEHAGRGRDHDVRWGRGRRRRDRAASTR